MAYDLTALRSSVVPLGQYEKMALATYLTGISNPKFQDLVILDMDKLTGQLAEACELSAIFSAAIRVSFAVELLELLHLDGDEFEEDEKKEMPNDGNDNTDRRYGYGTMTDEEKCRYDYRCE